MSQTRREKRKLQKRKTRERKVRRDRNFRRNGHAPSSRAKWWGFGRRIW